VPQAEQQKQTLVEMATKAEEAENQAAAAESDHAKADALRAQAESAASAAERDHDKEAAATMPPGPAKDHAQAVVAARDAVASHMGTWAGAKRRVATTLEAQASFHHTVDEIEAMPEGPEKDRSFEEAHEKEQGLLEEAEEAHQDAAEAEARAVAEARRLEELHRQAPDEVAAAPGGVRLMPALSPRSQGSGWGAVKESQSNGMASQETST